MRRQLLALGLIGASGCVFAGTLKIDGEVYAQRTAALMPYMSALR